MEPECKTLAKFVRKINNKFFDKCKIQFADKILLFENFVLNFALWMERTKKEQQLMVHQAIMHIMVE